MPHDEVQVRSATGHFSSLGTQRAAAEIPKGLGAARATEMHSMAERRLAKYCQGHPHSGRPVQEESDSQELDWGAVLVRYRALLLRVATGFAGDSSRAEDLVQGVFAATLVRLRAGSLCFDSAAHARNYLLRALRNQSIDDLRQPDHNRARDLGERLTDPVDPGASPIELAAEAEALESAGRRSLELAAAVSQLRSQEREALRLRYQEGLSFPAMARQTGTAASTWNDRVEGALGKLRRILGRLGTTP